MADLGNLAAAAHIVGLQDRLTAAEDEIATLRDRLDRDRTGDTGNDARHQP